MKMLEIECSAVRTLMLDASGYANDRRPRVGGHAGHRSRNLRHVVSSARDHPLLSADHARRGFLTVSSSPNVA
ncbi:hypothetical protein ANTRET_LOCUS4056 [Anthophora retusa]